MSAIVEVRYGRRTIRYIRPRVVIKVLNDFSIPDVRKKKTWEERYFLVSFMFWTGLRASEVLLTKRGDIDFVSKILYAPTLKKGKRRKKNGEEKENKKKEKKPEKRPIGLDHIPIDTLQYWEKFLSGLDFSDKIISLKTRYGIYRAIREFFEYFGIKGVHPHMLRHSIAIYLASQGMPINALQAFLRHTNPANTAIYYSISGLDTKPFLREIARKRQLGLEVWI